ncbi:Similar to Ankyrin repeat domain-containing protein 50; acc. no. Q9ULJ7 [Pyronema omphalodes CBS 100304]|uniref:Similar to Ankyrin repeat domain-containing protein 50 acc. no. Q9ULJ7 n=1 Tax=Pyronema omphalodes (strain CBS 100304) TaxID=1076935 RepID=U4LGL7_PYROM|nr:Similar to Ankyrin repeat domain-containing protein 50; acc. no. Q9ULJ7 [Pyronema omphalodes CBS 100304]
MAIIKGHKEVACLLLEKGADVDIQDRFGNTPLSIAAQNGHMTATRILLEKGADINLRDNDGRTPLELAEQQMISLEDDDTSRAAYEAIVNLLKERGGIL